MNGHSQVTPSPTEAVEQIELRDVTPEKILGPDRVSKTGRDGEVRPSSETASLAHDPVATDHISLVEESTHVQEHQADLATAVYPNGKH